MKIKKSDLLNMVQEQNDVIAKLIRQVNCHHEDIIRIEGIVEPEPQLKQLDQSVFDGAHEMWRFASVDADGAGFRFAERPELTDCFWRNVNCSRFDRLSQSGTYNASNWQNSLIERDIAKELLEVDLSSELTGSELCLKLLNLDRDVMCDVKDGDYRLIFAHDGEFFISHNKGERERHERVTPINNKGEPLTASEAGF